MSGDRLKHLSTQIPATPVRGLKQLASGAREGRPPPAFLRSLGFFSDSCSGSSIPKTRAPNRRTELRILMAAGRRMARIQKTAEKSNSGVDWRAKPRTGAAT